MLQKHIPLFAAGRSERGNVRAKNEDTLCVDPPLFIVADGLGGGPRGEVASRMAVELISCQVLSRRSQNPGAASTALIRAIEEANREIHKLSINEQGHLGMGTTVVAAVVVGNLIFIAHVGDSRAYYWRPASRALHRLTRDHTWKNERAFAAVNGQTATAIYDTSSSANLDLPNSAPEWGALTRSLGNRAKVKVDLNTFALDEGDALLLCSDGLTNMVPEDKIARAFREHCKPQEIVKALIRAALAHGGGDNVTAIVCGLGERYKPPG